MKSAIPILLVLNLAASICLASEDVELPSMPPPKTWKIDGAIASDAPKLFLLSVEDQQDWIDLLVQYFPRSGDRSVIDCVLIRDGGLVFPSVAAFGMEIRSGDQLRHVQVTHTVADPVTNTVRPSKYELCFPVDAMKGFQTPSTICFRIPRKLLDEPGTTERKKEITIGFDEVRSYSNGSSESGRHLVSEPIALTVVNGRWHRLPGKVVLMLTVSNESPTSAQ